MEFEIAPSVLGDGVYDSPNPKDFCPMGVAPVGPKSIIGEEASRIW